MLLNVPNLISVLGFELSVTVKKLYSSVIRKRRDVMQQCKYFNALREEIKLRTQQCDEHGICT